MKLEYVKACCFGVYYDLSDALWSLKYRAKKAIKYHDIRIFASDALHSIKTKRINKKLSSAVAAEVNQLLDNDDWFYIKQSRQSKSIYIHTSNGTIRVSDHKESQRGTELIKSIIVK